MESYRNNKDMQQRTAIETRRWTRQEYDTMIDAGVFAPGERVELIEGEILRMGPQKSAHAAGVRAVEEALRTAFGAGYDVRVQLPLALCADSEPEPDVAVVQGSWRDYRDAHPAAAVLVVEVSDSTVDYDRDWKGSLYARAGVAEYWILNLAERRLEVYRDPAPSTSGRRGFSYREVRHISPGQQISPLACPQCPVALHEILP